MAATAPTASEGILQGRGSQGHSPWQRFARRFARHRLGMAGLVVLGLVTGVALLAPWLAPYPPDEMLPAGFLEPPTAGNPFGTDEIGRDIVSRVIWGARVSLQIVMLAIGLALVIGAAIGLLSGYVGGWVDSLIMRVMDALLAFPLLVLALAIVAILGPDLINAMIAIAVTKVPGFARLVRSEVLSLKSADFVKAARVLGASHTRILVRHLWPNVTGNVIVYGSLSASQALITESALSFLGLGVRPPTPSWGYMVATGIEFWQAWWMSFFPGLAIFVTVLAFNIVGDAARDALDTRNG